MLILKNSEYTEIIYQQLRCSKKIKFLFLCGTEVCNKQTIIMSTTKIFPDEKTKLQKNLSQTIIFTLLMVRLK